MGLRERKAERTRESIIDVALGLFVSQGYDATTMEQIAEGAEIGTTTLYRYFATKEALIVEPLGVRGELASALLARPADEPLDQALGEAIRAFVRVPRLDAGRQRELYSVIRSNHGPRARLYELFVEERTHLEQVIARRLGRPEGDLYSVVTARVTTMLIELISEMSAEVDPGAAGVEERTTDLVRTVTDEIRRNPPTIPRLEP